MSIINELRQRCARALEALDAGDMEACRTELIGAPSCEKTPGVPSLAKFTTFREKFNRMCNQMRMPAAAVVIVPLDMKSGDVHFAGDPHLVKLISAAFVDGAAKVPKSASEAGA